MLVEFTFLLSSSLAVKSIFTKLPDMMKFSKPLSESVVTVTLSSFGGILSNMIFEPSEVVFRTEKGFPAGSVKKV